jgi:Predicted transcriptional regulator
MITYQPLFELLKKRNITKYQLVNKTKLIGGATFDKLKANAPINTNTIDKLCNLLDCQPGDIMEYLPHNSDN